MRRINGKRIISSTMCALMIASLSVPTVATYGAEMGATQEVRGVERIGDTSGLKYYDYPYNSFDFQVDMEALKGDTLLGVKCGVGKLSGELIKNTILPKNIKEFLGWDVGFFGTNQPAMRKLGYGKSAQSFSFEVGSNTLVSHIEFQSIAEVIVPANTTIHFVNSIFGGKVTIEQGGTAIFENCTFTNGMIANSGTATYTGTTIEPMNTVKPKPVVSDLALDDVTLSNNLAEVGKTYDASLIYTLTGTNKDTASVETVVLPADKGITATAENINGTVTVTISGTPREAGNYIISTKAIDVDGTMISKEVSVTVNEKQMIPLTLTQIEDTLSEGVIGTEYNKTITYSLAGTNLETATVNAIVTPDNGLAANAVNNNGTVTVTVLGKPTVVGEFTVTTTASTENSSTSESVKSTIETSKVAESIEFVLDDNYYNLDVQLRDSLKNATIMKLAYGNITVSKENETTTIPKQVTKFVGWQKKIFFQEATEVVQRLGSGGENQTLTFEEGSNIVVRKITFEKGVHVVVPKGVTVTFENCTFDKTMTNEGTAVFNNCTFSTGQITNNGAVEYINGTEIPMNVGREDTGTAHFPLGMEFGLTTLKDGVKGQEYYEEMMYTLSGTNQGTATVTAEVIEKESGLMAKIENGKVIVFGTPTSAMTVNVKVVVHAEGDTPVEKVLTLNTYAPFQVELAGSLNCIVMPKAKQSRIRVDAVTRATGSVGGSSSSVVLPDGSTSAQNTLTPYVVLEDGTKVKWFEYSRDHSGATIETNVFPEGSGLTAECLFGTVTLKGEPLKTGEFYVTVTVKDKGQEVTSNKIDFRVYRGDETLKEQLGTVKANQVFWDVEPYEIAKSDHAIIPTTLKKIYGSHQSGTYGIIGNSDMDKVDTDTIVIPAGCDVTFENVKIYSSIRIIVEKGGSLTLSDSVSFGKIEVNGGTFAMGNSSAICDELILNDGSTLKGKDIKVMTSDGMVTKQGTQIKSHAHFLTDGADKEYSPENVVVINGTVTVDGDVQIQGDVGSGNQKGQTALRVKGDLVIPAGSSVKALGGGAAPEDKTYMPAKFGGNGIVLENGRILGEGLLTAIGGISYDGRAGHGITGNGDIMVASLESTGGNATAFLPNSKVIGGDAVQQDVAVMTKPERMKLTAGKALKMDGTHIGGTVNGIDGTAVISKNTPSVIRPNESSDSDETSGDIQGNNVGSNQGSNIEKKPEKEQSNVLGENSVSVPIPFVPVVANPSISEIHTKENTEDIVIDNAIEKEQIFELKEDKNSKEQHNRKETIENKASKDKKKEKKTTTKQKVEFYYKKANGISIIEALKRLKVDSSFSFRKEIAKANGIKNYKGTAKQNMKLLELIKKGKLRKPKKEVK